MIGTSDLFPHFSTQRVETGRAEIFVRKGGEGPPLLLLHGYPQTHVCWHKIAPRLAESFTVIACDLKGYGESAARDADSDATEYSKRAVAADLVAVVRELGFERFSVAGHDRGGRVAYRMALDHPHRIDRLAVLSIVPTAVMWRLLQNNEYALKTFHWFLLAQPSALPRLLIEGAPIPYLHEVLSSWAGPQGLSAFAPEAMAAYEAALVRPGAIAGACADYRAGWTADRLDDEHDLEHGRKIKCPTLVLVDRKHFPEADVVAGDWAGFAPQAEVRVLDCGHFLAEEAPEETFSAFAQFFCGSHADASEEKPAPVQASAVAMTGLLLGGWRLISWTIENPDGTIGYPLGEDATGQLTYTSDGRMSAQLARRSVARFASNDWRQATAGEKAQAWSNYFGYFGTYSLDEEANTIEHHIEGSWFPNLVGTTEKRRYRFDGKQLVLDAETAWGKVRIIWEKTSSEPAAEKPKAA